MPDRVRDSKESKLPLCALLLFAVATKVGLAVWVHANNPSAIWHPDSLTYHKLALNLLRYGLFSTASHAPFPFETWRTPGYPALLALVYGVFGDHAIAAVLLNVLLASITVFLTWLLGKTLFDSRVGLWAAALVTLDLASLTLGQMLMSETAFSMLLTLGILFLVRGMETGLPNYRQLGLAGLCLALATFVRPVSYYLVPILTVAVATLIVLSKTDNSSRRMKLRRAVLAGLCLIAVPASSFAAWQVTKYVRTGSPGFSHVAGRNVLFYRAAGVVALAERTTLHDVHARMGFQTETGDFSGYLGQHRELEGLSEAQLADHWLDEGMRLLLRHPFRAFGLHFRSTLALLFDPASFELGYLLGLVTEQQGREFLAVLQLRPTSILTVLWREHRAVLILSICSIFHLLLLYAGLVVGLVFGGSARWRAGLGLVGLVALYLVTVSAGPEARARFRVPIVPFTAVLSVGGAALVRTRRSRASQVPDLSDRDD